MHSIGLHLKDIWIERFSSLSESRLRFDLLLKDLGLEKQQLKIENINFQVPSCRFPKEWPELISLEASFIRREESVEASSQLLKKLGDFQLVRNFGHSFQLGLNAMSKDRFDEALGLFNHALSITSDDDQSLAAQLNSMICVESLGFDFSDSLRDFERKYLASSQRMQSALAAQFYALKARVAFRLGDDQSLLELCAMTEINDQQLQFLCFATAVRALSNENFVNIAQDLKKRLVRKTPAVYQLYFDLNTLAFRQTADEDMDKIRSSRLAERLYLWTRKWLCSGDMHLLAGILQIYANLAQRPHPGTLDDQMQISCATQWLRCFGLEDSQKFGSLGALTPLSDPRSYPMYRKELACIERVATGCLTWRNELLDFGFDAADAIMKQLSVDGTNGSAIVKVDLLNKSITNKKQSVVNPEMTQALVLLMDHDALSLNRFCMDVFGYRNFDLQRHQARLSKLCNRINQVLDRQVRVRRKQGYIFLDGNKELICLMNASPMQRDIMRLQANLLGLESRRREALKDAQNIDGTLAECFSRTELQTFWGVSKSQALILIEQYLSLGTISKSGVGKATRYHVSDSSLLDRSTRT